MPSQSYSHAFDTVLELISNLDLASLKYHGTLDITEHIDFAGIASQFDLTELEYENLIEATENHLKTK